MSKSLRAALVVIVAGVGLMSFILWRSDVAQGTVHGKALGKFSDVALIDFKRGVVRAGEIDAQGEFRVEIPPAAKEPSLVIHGPGHSLVQSGILKLKKSQTLAPLALWQSPIRIKRDGRKIRFDWSPIPRGEGYPKGRIRYSLLIAYPRTKDRLGEYTMLSKKPAVEVHLQELKDLLVEWDSEIRDMRITLRAYDLDDEGPLWVAGERNWVFENE